jgi:carboxymethylenebutenolidase
MSRQDHPATQQDVSPNNPSRRDFVALSAAAGLAAGSGAIRGAEVNVIEQDVVVKTADGSSDAAFIHPASGAHPGVLLWTDAFGLRPSMRAMGKRLAAEGYAVLIPNPYYRSSKAPQFESAANVDFARDRSKFQPLMEALNQPGHVESDAKAYVAWLDTQKAVNKKKKVGTQGYCMGGALAFRTAATVSDRVGAVGTFHGGGLVTDKPDSPHLLAPSIKARLYIAIASNDDQKQPDAKDKLKEAFGSVAEIEVYSQDQHGWCVSDMPTQNGQPIYNQADADRAWGKLLALYKGALS